MKISAGITLCCLQNTFSLPGFPNDVYLSQFFQSPGLRILTCGDLFRGDYSLQKANHTIPRSIIFSNKAIPKNEECKLKMTESIRSIYLN